jgi:DNA replication and repair protein RecF
MPLVSLELQNVRIYERAKFTPGPHLNLITGKNATGKTTLIEAIYLLGTGRSFRTTKIGQLHRNKDIDLTVVGKIDNPDSNTQVQLGLIHGNQGRRIAINGIEQTQASSLAQQLPLLAISPETHYEFLNSAKYRRGVLDWSLFHVEQDFPKLWARNQRILSQRNAALKNHNQTHAQHVWDEEFVETSEKIHAGRIRLIEQLLPIYQLHCRELLGTNYRVDLKLDAGWTENFSLSKCLSMDRTRDLAQGFTHCGPQRADLQITLDEQVSKFSASHGQHKMLVIALRLAQIQYFIESKGQQCCLLVDDLAAELDLEHRWRLTKILASLPVQTFVTSTEVSPVDQGSWLSSKTFHVEQGMVAEIF